MHDSRSFLQRLISHPGAHLALSDGADIKLSYAQLTEEVTQLASLLGEQRTQGLAIEVDNCPAWVVADLAAIQASTWTLPLPPFFTPTQRKHALEESGCGLLLSDNPAVNAQAVSTLSVASRTLYLYKLEHSTTGRVHAKTSKVTFTSGSTGSPKGLCLSNSNMWATANAITEALPVDLVERHLCVLPLSILLENIAGLYATLLRGKTYIVPPLAKVSLAKTSANDCALSHIIKTSAANSCILVPELLAGLLPSFEHKRAPTELRYVAVGGAKTAPSVLQKAEQMLLPVFEGYGLSEAASVVSTNTPTASNPGSVGRLLPSQSITIDKQGEIWLTKAGFLGYCNDTTEPPSPFPTGDLGRLDSEGYLHISGRKKNLLITSMGRNVSPEWVETELNSEPGIQQSLVYGDADQQLSALLVSHDKRSGAVERAIEKVNQRLPNYASIGKVELVPPFTPQNGLLTGNGKLKRESILKHHSCM